MRVLPRQPFHALRGGYRPTKHVVSLIPLFVAIFARETLAGKKPFLRDGLFYGDKFTPVREFTDEFWGSFNHRKWYDRNPRWKGRQPGLFASKNVKQKHGQLFLKGVYEKPGSSIFDGSPGYSTYTTAFVESKKLVKYGYFEVKAKPGNSRLSSSFWAARDTPELWTEIDVFEIGGGAYFDNTDFRRKINMNLHVHRHRKKGILRPGDAICKPCTYTHSSFLRSRFNTYGLDWSKRFITWTFNGRAIRRDRNHMWRQPLSIKFDVETMMYFFGLPSKRTLPATYKLKYIRVWKRGKTPASRRFRSTTRMCERELCATTTSRLLRTTFGLGIGLPGSLDGNEDEDENDEDDGEDTAETEVFAPTEPETDAPQDGLQRSPIPGSNEILYQPVVPTLRRNWSDIIAQQDLALDDVHGAQIAHGEKIDIMDFDEELVLFPAAGVISPAGSSNDGPSSGLTSQAVSPPGSFESSETANDSEGPQSWLDGFYQGLPTFPWSS